MSVSHQEYLLKKYLSGSGLEDEKAGSKKKSKKKRDSNPDQSTLKKRKRKALLIDEDNDAVWQNEFDEDDAPILVGEKVVQAHFLSSKKSGWTTIKGGENDEPQEDSEEEKDKEEEEEDSDEEARMASGARVGLQTGEQVAADIKRQEMLIRKKLRAMKPEEIGRDAETVYRDAKGRRLNMEDERAKVEAQEREKAELEKAILERNKGNVQKEQAQLRREALAKASTQTLARYADDAEMNAELKERPRWDDPSAAFLSASTKKKTRYPKYLGPAPPPNRFNIQPGYRWDGVDRSNGYEKEIFLRMNSRKAQAAEQHAWSTEDM
ncbi:Pre-mRNA-splicing factor cwc26 [Entomophthora muscae]|uniref:Pre-mRNA-splicing factor cwc26 n=1 Tax=Entomophthora muscae TaxID=34485 RepID=A0ACC2T974_9FUNG|nr:Pre-mRNA-splicing factor cwc26 [Entomophthora muscae]